MKVIIVNSSHLLLNITIIIQDGCMENMKVTMAVFLVNMFNQLLGYVLPKMLLKYKTNCSHD